MRLKAARGDGIVAYFRFRINLLLPLSFDRAIFVVCLHLTCHKTANFSPRHHPQSWVDRSGPNLGRTQDIDRRITSLL